jgi:hypothetical protein
MAAISQLVPYFGLRLNKINIARDAIRSSPIGMRRIIRFLD